MSVLRNGDQSARVVGQEQVGDWLAVDVVHGVAQLFWKLDRLLFNFLCHDFDYVTERQLLIHGSGSRF